MKKLALLFIFSASLTFNHAQGISLGFKVGANLSGATGKAFKDGFNFGYQLGLFSELKLNKKYGIQPELLFTESAIRPAEGLNSLYQGQTIAGLTRIKLQYLNIPVLFNYKPLPLLSLQIGPQFGILTSQTKLLKDNALDVFKNGDLSIVAGVQLTVLKFRVHGRYAIGAKNINAQDLQTWKSQQVQLGVGVTL